MESKRKTEPAWNYRRECVPQPRPTVRPSHRALLLCASVAAFLFTSDPSTARSPDPSPTASKGSAGISTPGGGFMVTPHRLVFEARRRSAAVSLINSGDDSASFRVTLVRMRMSETGQFTVVDSPEAGEAFADTLVRYSPRQVELGPRESQVIRLQLRKPADLATGEYRSHLLVQSIPRTRAIADSGASDSSGGMQIRIVPIYGTAIPVIVRHGVTEAEVSFSDLKFEADGTAEPATASLVIHRKGNRSAYGDLTLTHIPDRGESQIVGVMRGISVYSPNPTRTVRVPLTTSAGLTTGGRLLVSYAEPSPDGRPIAESSFTLP